MKAFNAENKAIEFRFMLENDTYEYKREVYTIWELFGDIGGLTEVAVIFAGITMSIKTFLFGSGLDQYLLSELFFVEKQNPKTMKMSSKPAKFKSWLCLRKLS